MKCFNCGKDVKNNLRFCTNCGVSLGNDMEKSVEIISNKEDEGRDIANDKTAILVIILSLLLGIFVVVMGIYSINRYKCLDDCDIVKPQEIEIKEVVFDTDTEFELYGRKYKFKDNVSSYINGGFSISSYDENSNNREKSVFFKKSNSFIYADVINENSNNVDIENYVIKELSFEYSNIKDSNFVELPEGVMLGDSIDDVLDIYGENDYKNDNCYVYRYENSNGHIELCFKNDLLNSFKIVN